MKLNESRQLKFYQKENPTENSAEKNFKEYSQLNELWNISTKQKRKRKILKFKELWNISRRQKILTFKELFSSDTLSDKFLQIVLKFATLYLFYPFLSCFFCIKFPFKKLYCLCYLFESVSELESCGIYCLNLPFGFSVTHTSYQILFP